MLDLRRLKYIQAIAQHGSLTRASQVLGVAQPALSHHLSELEAYFKAELFHRTPRGMVPTDVGRILSEHAALILRGVEDAETAARHGLTTLAGTVSLGLLNTVALRLAVPLLQRCSEKYPDIRLFLTEGTSKSLQESMARQELDLAVNLSEAIEGEASMIASERLILASKRQPGAPEGPITFAEAVAKPLILPSRDHILRKLVEWGAQQKNLTLNIRYELGGGWTLKSAVAAGLGDTIISQAAITPDELGSRILVRPIVDPVLERRLSLVQSSIRASAPAVAAVRAVLLSLFVEFSGPHTWTVADAIRTDDGP